MEMQNTSSHVRTHVRTQARNASAQVMAASPYPAEDALSVQESALLLGALLTLASVIASFVVV